MHAFPSTSRTHLLRGPSAAALAAGMLLWASATVQAQNYYGSIAFAPTPDGGYAGGMAWNRQHHATARESALNECRWAGGGDACREVGWFQNACGAIAIGDGNGYGTGWGDTDATAERAALAACRKANQTCRIEISRCTELTTASTVELDRSARRRIQAALTAQGFDPGPADGIFGGRTQAALQAWQTARGYPATGNLTPDQARILLAAHQVKPQEPSNETPTPKQNGDLWGSIAFSQNPQRGHAWALVWNTGGAPQAKQLGLDLCRREGGQNCREIGWFRNACGALAIGDGNGFGAGWGTTIAAAEHDSLSKCRSVNENCRLEVSRCSDKPTETAGVAQASVIAIFPKCPDELTREPCWRELINQPGCHVFLGASTPNVEWTGSCSNGIATGMGILRFTKAFPREWECTLSRGRLNGQVIFRAEGAVSKGQYVDGLAHGRHVTTQHYIPELVGCWREYSNGRLIASDQRLKCDYV